MDNISSLFKALDLVESTDDTTIKHEYIDVFKNPNKLPINQVHLNKTVLELRKDVNLDDLKWDKNLESKYFDRKVSVLPALDRSWLPPSPPFFKYVPYNFCSLDNSSFLSNRLFVQSLNHLLKCNYHQFWCLILFEPQVTATLHSFLVNPILEHEVQYLKEEYAEVYQAVFSSMFLVYRRLLTFKHSQVEHMSEDLGLNYLLDKKLINLPIVITLILLYQDTDAEFVNALVSMYFSHESAFRDKEIEEILNQSVMTLEMIGGHVCGFESRSVIVPIAIEERPPVFSLNWVYSVVSYLLYTISALGALLKFYKPATEVALSKDVPYRLSFTYERVYCDLYTYLEDRTELFENSNLADLIYEQMALGRSEFIEVYNAFVSHCLDRTLKFSGDPVRQEEVIEIYLKLMTSALEDEYFICDYHEVYDVGMQNEMFTSCCSGLDPTRTDYVVTCINNFRRHSKLQNALKIGKNLIKTRKKYGRHEPKYDAVENGGDSYVPESIQEPSTTLEVNDKPSSEQIENLIRMVLDMFPHLGDGFVLKCLEAYNYRPDDVISAILEENLPPHIIDIPFDVIRIPPEPKPAEPVLAYKGKKPDYDNAMQLLNDKKDLKEVKTFILDGIKYGNEYDPYDDEYDDRLDEETVAVPDYGSEDVLKYNPNYEDAVSDTSYSENEYDDKGEPVKAPEPGRNDRGDSKNKGAFCEDPAVIRARREARMRSQGKHVDVVGKPKGQGQDKTVDRNRQKKNVNKSSKANHSRKTGAQWKRSRGMFPS